MDLYALVKDFAAPFATIIAAGTAAYIAKSIARSQVAVAAIQAKTANDRLVLDLFERRLEIYTKVRTVLARIMTNGKVQPDDSFKFLGATDGARFLFGKEVTDYFDTLYEAILDVEMAEHEEQGSGSHDDRRKALEVRRKHRSTLSDFYKRAPELLAPYLSAHQRFTAT